MTKYSDNIMLLNLYMTEYNSIYLDLLITLYINKVIYRGRGDAFLTSSKEGYFKSNPIKN